MAEEKGIKEISELIAGLELVAVAAKKIGADGKVNMADIPVAVEVLTKMSALVAAVDGINQLPAEVKDLSGEEAQELLTLLLAAVRNVKAA